MIKPESYWALHKYSDPLTLGRVGVALAGREEVLSPPLTDAEKALVAVIRQDGEWFDERIEAQRQRWKERQKKKRDNGNITQHHAVSPNITVTKRDKESVTQHHAVSQKKCQCHDTSLPPSLPPSNTLSNESVYISRAPAQESDIKSDALPPTRGGIPSEKTVVSAATTVMGVPEAFARWWYREMTARDWTNTDGSPIGNRNWRPTLKAWYNRATPDELAEVKRQQEETKPRVVSYKPEDWLLCAERCAAFADCRCSAGKIVPPQFRPHPIPPEECDRFRPAVANR